MGDTNIEWAEKTWNPVTGCSKVSPGCAHCYAETLALNRLAGKAGYPGLPWTPENAKENVVLRPERLDQPLRWRKPAMIFVNSMSDLFHELIPDEFIARVFATMAQSPRHTFQVLTKRPKRMYDLISDPGFKLDVSRVAGAGSLVPIQWPLPNVWLGTSIENRQFVDRADLLRQTPAAVRFISAEPLLGQLVVRDWASAGPRLRALGCLRWDDGKKIDSPNPELNLSGIDWLIVGGESGKGHRPIKEEWVRDIRDAAKASGTAFFLKQMGGYRPGDKLEDLPEGLQIREMPRSHAGVR